MRGRVYIRGGGGRDFKRSLKKEGKTIRHLIIEAGKKAIDDAKIDAGEVQAGTVGNFNAGQFTKQLQLGAFIPEIDPKLRGIPTMHTEAACASGALSVLLGAEWIMGGFHDVVLVVGAEQQKTMSSLDASDVLGAAADYHNEKPEYGDFMFPKWFSCPENIWRGLAAIKTSPRACSVTAIRPIICRWTRRMRRRLRSRAKRLRRHLAWQTLNRATYKERTYTIAFRSRRLSFTRFL